MVLDGCADAQRPKADSTRPRNDGQLDFLGLQLGHAQRHTGHILLGHVGGQLRPEGHWFPDHVTVPDQLDHPAGGQNRDGSDGVTVFGRPGGQRGGHKLSYVRRRGE